jgi:hypothetical protein
MMLYKTQEKIDQGEDQLDQSNKNERPYTSMERI